MEFIKYYNTPVGKIKITSDLNALISLDFISDNTINKENTFENVTDNKLLDLAYTQLSEYFNKKRRIFDIPLRAEGSDFQKMIWSNLQKIPYGRTRSYRQLANIAGNDKAYRAAGNANGKNPLPIFIPCHRVIHKNGGLGGFSADIKIKEKLLELEKSNSNWIDFKESDYNDLSSKDDKISELIKQTGILEYEYNPDLFENLVYNIINQQISMKAADSIWNKLKSNLVVTPENINLVKIGDISLCGISENKASYIKDTASKIVNGEIDLQELKTKSDDEIVSTLTKLRGVGKWTADMMLIFSFGRKNILSYEDYGIRRGICKLYGFDSISREEFDNYKKLYSPNCTLASLYLWNRKS